MLKRFILPMLLFIICGTVKACRPGTDMDFTIWDAARTGNVTQVKQMLDELRNGGAAYNVPDDKGMTPLHYAAINNHEDVVKMLLESGLTIQVRNPEGLTPTDLAKSAGSFSPETIHLLEQLPVMESRPKQADMPLLAEIFQSEAGFTCATDKKPIVATFGCGPCVALGGYDQVNHVAFVVHFALEEEVRACGQVIADHIRSLMRRPLTPETPIALHIHGGYKNMSEGTIKAIKEWMLMLPDLPMKIASEDVLDCCASRSLAIDSRTGAISIYDPDLNPNKKQLSGGLALMSGWDPHITVAYKASL